MQTQAGSGGEAYCKGSGGLPFLWDLYSLREALTAAQGREEGKRDLGILSERFGVRQRSGELKP